MLLPKPDSKAEKRAAKNAKAKRDNEAKRMVRSMAGYMCERQGCGLKGAHVHRIVFASHGGIYEVENCILLCAGCHWFVHNGTMWEQGENQTGWEFMIKILEPHVQDEGSLKHWQWRKVYDKLKSGDLT